MDTDFFFSDGVELAYVDVGTGEPILLIHGFASNLRVNWASTGWIDTLTGAGRRVVAMDVRGHGQSEKPYDPEAYRIEFMARDAANLIDHLGLGRADVMGYSMGARIAAFLAVRAPDRVRSAILGGLGMALVDGMAGGDAIVAALEAPSLADVHGEPGRAYRKFAEQTRSDLRALAACMTVARETLPPATLATIAVPVLVAVGEKDAVSGSGPALAALIPGAESLVIPNRDHMLATGAVPYKEGVLAFLRRRP